MININRKINIWGGIFIDNRKKIKWQNKAWNIKVSTYKNKRLCLFLENKKSIKEIIIDLNDAYLDNGHLFLDPETKDNGILQVLRKARIIRCITGISYYNYISVPIALVNMGILRKYDYKGTSEYLNIIRKGEIV